MSIEPFVPPGFVPHARRSPLTTPWKPLYAHHRDDAVVLGLHAAEVHTNARGLVHGGLISALADNAMGLSCAARLGDGSSLLTVSLNLDFLGVARIGQWLTFETQFVKTGGTLAFAQAFVMADEAVCARASASFRILAPRDKAA